VFLTKKAIVKIIVIVCIYEALGVFLLSAAFSAYTSGERGIFVPFLVIGCFLIPFGALTAAVGRYSEGKGKLLLKGRRLVLQELRPAAFITLYRETSASPNLVVAHPDPDILEMLFTAYGAAGDEQSQLAALEEMLATAPEKKRKKYLLFRSAYLYAAGRTEEAEQIYSAVTAQKLSLQEAAIADAVLKSDRAMAFGDWTTAENYIKARLAASFPPKTPYEILSFRFALAQVLLKSGRPEKAAPHLAYCAENGGETAIRSKAAALLQTL